MMWDGREFDGVILSWLRLLESLLLEDVEEARSLIVLSLLAAAGWAPEGKPRSECGDILCAGGGNPPPRPPPRG